MDPFNASKSLLELISHPAFYVQEGRIVQVNEAAKNRLIREGGMLSEYLQKNYEAYQAFSGGCLFLTLHVVYQSYPACVTKQEAGDLFVIDTQTDSTSHSLALAAIQLRQNLQTVFTALDDIPAHMQSGHMNQALMQMHRLLCNMSDLARYREPNAARMEATNLTSVFAETMEKSQTLFAVAGQKFHYEAQENVFSMADREMIERALWNLISNAAKFAGKKRQLKASMRRSGNLVYFTLWDNGDGIAPEILQNVYRRFVREPSIEDSRHGAGLGLAIVSSIASIHGGTVLIDQPASGGTRVTMTMTITPCPDQTLRSPVMTLFGDYCGGFDHGLLELSDILPANMYE